MIKRGCFFAAVFAAVAVTGQVQAGYTYTNTVTPSSVTSGGSTVSLTGNSSATTASGTTFMNLFNVGITSTTTPPATDSFTISFSDALQVTNVPPPGTSALGTFTVTGSIQFTRSDSGGEVSFFTLTSAASQTMMIDGVSYTISNFTYTPPTVNSVVGRGNVSALITASSAVPEPASITMLGLGAVGLVGFARRRKAVTA